MKTMTLIVNAILLGGCYAPALETSATSNPALTVQDLFTHDGCHVYRFYDNGAHYFVKCESVAARAQTESRIPCGKGCVHEESIPTIPGKDTPAPVPRDASHR